MPVTDVLVICIAAFFAGVLNAMAGGGSFLTFPALVLIGVPPVAANATSAVAVFPGYLSSTVGYLEELRAFDRRRLVQLVVLACVGGVVGALLLLATPAALFRNFAPWLLLFATLLFAFGDRLSRHIPRAGTGSSNRVAYAAVVLLVCTYGGYFNGGLGIILLALFAAMGFENIHLMNGLKNGLSFLLSMASVATFALAGIVRWPEALIMMVMATGGGYVGARVARRMPVIWIKRLVVLVGAAMSVLFFVL